MFSVLYVDDEPGLLDIGKLFLESYGDFSVSTVTSATDALENLKTKHFDAIIADYQMPVMDGLEFLKKVRHRHGNIPYILFTGRGREEVVINALNLGADFYLQKGGDPQAQFAELAHKIRQAVQRRRVEVALEESERRYRAVIESQTELICRFRPDGTLLFINGAFCTYYGKTVDDLIGKPFHHEIPPGEREQNRQHFSSLTSDNPVGTTEHRVLMPDGSVRWQQWTDRAIFDEYGEIAEYQSVGRDITDRRQAEEAVVKSENLYRTVFTTTGAATVIIAPDTTILLANTGWERLTGMPRAEQEGKVSWTVFFNKEDTDRMVKYHHDRRRDPSLAPDVYESRLIDVNKGVHYCFVHVRMIPGTKNSVASLVDITDRKKTEESLRESEEKFRVMAESSPAAIIVYQENRLIYINDSTAEMSGYSKDELYAMDFWDIFPPGCQDAIRERGLARQRGENVPGRYEVRLVTRQGEPRWAYLSAGTILIGGKTAGIAMLVDITERKKTGELLKESEEKFRALAEHAPVAIGVIQDNRYVYVNGHFIRAMGYSREELAANDYWIYVRKDQQEKIIEDGRAWARGEPGPWRNELEYYTKSGEARWAVSTSAHIMYGGRHAGIVALVGITERKKAEEDLQAAYRQLAAVNSELKEQYARLEESGRRIRQSEQDYRTILENMQDAFYRTDLQGSLTMVSPSFVREMGYADEKEILGKNVRDQFYVDPRDRDPFLKELERTGQVKEHRVTLRRRDGSRVVVSATSHVLRDESGKPAGVEGILRDVTATVEAEEALRESEAKFRTILDTASEWIWDMDLSGRHTYSNPAIGSLLGYTHEEFMAFNAFDLMHPEDRERVKTVFAESVSEKKGWRNIIIRWRHKDGTYRFFESTATTILDSDGRLAGFRGVDRDITETWQAEEALRESEAHYRLLADHVHDVIWTADMDMRLTYVSPSVTALRGMTPEEALNESLRDALTPASLATILQRREQELAGLQSGEPATEYQSMELEFYRKDGSTVWTETVLSPAIGRDGKPCGVVGVMRDITARKQAEYALRQASRKLNLLTGITRHDIKNQLLVLKGFLKLLQKGEQDEKLSDYCRKAIAAAERISSIIQFSREYEALGLSTPDWQEVRTLLDRELVQAPLGRVVAENRIPAGLEVFADPLVARVFYNLMDNSLRHGETVTAIRITVEDRDDAKVIVWEDNGTGVPAGEKELIFERGFGRNTGHALSLSREILAITGMTIRETGVPGTGARFEITVPKGAYRFAGR